MTGALRKAYEAELAAAAVAIAAGNTELAFHHLARAHILSQRHTIQHVYTHWLMLKLGASVGAWGEVAGQLSRIIAAAIFSRIWIPEGNTGRAKVSAIKPMPVPVNLRALLERGGV
jgi:Protein of unknown function (DUF3703)